VAAIARKGNVTHFVCGMEGSANQITAGPYVSGPWQDDIPKGHIGPRLKALQSAFVDQIITKLTEAEPSLVVAEARPGDDGEPYISEARAIAVAMLEAEIHHSANHEGLQVFVGKQCRRDDFAENFQSVEDVQVGHQWQVNELLDWPISKTRPD